MACNDEPAERPPKTLTEKLSIFREGEQLKLETDLKDFELYLFQDGQFLDQITVRDRTLSVTPSHSRDVLAVITSRDTFFVAERQIASDGGPHNLRDLGGLFTREGYQVKWNMLYRSDKLSTVSIDHSPILEPLEVSTIVDFRLDEEVADDPDQWPGLEYLNHIHLPVGDTTKGRAAWFNELRKPDFSPDSMMYQINRTFAMEYAPQFRKFSQLLLEEDTYPILYHCTAGKDRTGFASAIVLMALGVGRETIIAEYLQSNHYIHDHLEAEVRKAVMFAGLDENRLRPLMGVRRSFIQGAFDVIDSEYESQERFLCEVMGLCEQEIERLKSRLLYDYATPVRGQ